MSHAARKTFFGVSPKSDTNWLVQSQKKARSLNFRINEEEKFYYLCRGNKGPDQLCSDCTADLHCCF